MLADFEEEVEAVFEGSEGAGFGAAHKFENTGVIGEGFVGFGAGDDREFVVCAFDLHHDDGSFDADHAGDAPGAEGDVADEVFFEGRGGLEAGFEATEVVGEEFVEFSVEEGVGGGDPVGQFYLWFGGFLGFGGLFGLAGHGDLVPFGFSWDQFDIGVGRGRGLAGAGGAGSR